MGRRAKRVKVRAEVKPPAARKARKNEGQRISDLEKRLAEALGQLQTRTTSSGGARAPDGHQEILESSAVPAESSRSSCHRGHRHWTCARQRPVGSTGRR